MEVQKFSATSDVDDLDMIADRNLLAFGELSPYFLSGKRIHHCIRLVYVEFKAAGFRVIHSDRLLLSPVRFVYQQPLILYLGKWLASRYSKYSLRYGNGLSGQMNTATTSPSLFRNLSNPPFSLSFEMKFKSPASAKPELAPAMIPARQSSELFSKDSLCRLLLYDP